MDIKEECMYRSKKNILYAMCVYIIGFCILLLCIAAILVLILDASSLNTAPGGVIGGMAVILIFIVFGWGALGFILSFLCEKIMCYETFCTIRWVNWRFQIATYKLNYDEIMGYKMNIPSKGPRSFSF